MSTPKVTEIASRRTAPQNYSASYRSRCAEIAAMDAAPKTDAAPQVTK